MKFELSLLLATICFSAIVSVCLSFVAHDPYPATPSWPCDHFLRPYYPSLFGHCSSGSLCTYSSWSPWRLSGEIKISRSCDHDWSKGYNRTRVAKSSSCTARFQTETKYECSSEAFRVTSRLQSESVKALVSQLGLGNPSYRTSYRPKHGHDLHRRDDNGCDDKRYLVIILDTSGSIGKKEFEEKKLFIAHLLRHLCGNTHIAVIKYGSSVAEVNCFNDYTTTSSALRNRAVADNLEGTAYLGGMTYTDRALKYVQTDVLATTCGWTMPSNSDQPGLDIVTVTDGGHNGAGRNQVQSLAISLSSTTIKTTLYALAIGETDVNLPGIQNLIINRPDEPTFKHIFFVTDVQSASYQLLSAVANDAKVSGNCYGYYQLPC